MTERWRWSNELTGKVLATASRDKTIRLWRRETSGFEHVLTLRSPSGPFKTLRFANDGRQLIALVHGETALRVWHLDHLREHLGSLRLDW